MVVDAIIFVQNKIALFSHSLYYLNASNEMRFKISAFGNLHLTRTALHAIQVNYHRYHPRKPNSI